MNRLKELRIENNLLQNDMAKVLNLTQGCYSKYEMESLDIPTNILKKISKYYNVSIDYILKLTDTKETYSTSIVLDSPALTWLKEIREDRDLLQKDIAKILNMSRTGYADYESGKNDISTSVLKKLAKYYKVSIDYLLYMTDERKPYSKSKLR